MVTSTSETLVEERTILGHPRAIMNLAGLGIWERFSFFGTQIILMYYLYFSVSDGGLGLATSTAISLTATFGALVYCATVIGAWVSDRLLGPERTLFYSIFTIMFGHLALAVLPGMLGLAVGLSLLVVGTGGSVSNLPSSVGLLYKDKDPRRDAGFILLYTGLNVGALAGPLLTGLVRSHLGFHFGFGLAAVGLAFGLALYAPGRKRIGPVGRVAPNPLPRDSVASVAAAVVLCISVFAAATALGIVTLDNLGFIVTVIVALTSVSYFVIMLRSPKTNTAERRRVRALIPLFIAVAVFFALYHQQFTVVQVYAAERVNLDAFGFPIPPEFFNSVIPAFVIVVGPAYAALWTSLGSRQPSSPVKFLIGLLVIVLAFLLFLPTAASRGAVIAPIALIGILLVFTLSELFVAPVQLSLATEIAPTAFRTQTVSLMYLSIALGSSGGGIIAKSYDPATEFNYFLTVALGALVVAAVYALTIPWTKRMLNADS